MYTALTNVKAMQQEAILSHLPPMFKSAIKVDLRKSPIYSGFLFEARVQAALRIAKKDASISFQQAMARVLVNPCRTSGTPLVERASCTITATVPSHRPSTSVVRTVPAPAKRAPVVETCSQTSSFPTKNIEHVFFGSRPSLVPDSSWSLPCQQSRRLARDWSGGLGPRCVQQRLPDSFHYHSTSHLPSSWVPVLPLRIHESSGIGSRGSASLRKRGVRGGLINFRILQPSLCGAKGHRRLPPDSRTFPTHWYVNTT